MIQYILVDSDHLGLIIIYYNSVRYCGHWPFNYDLLQFYIRYDVTSATFYNYYSLFIIYCGVVLVNDLS